MSQENVEMVRAAHAHFARTGQPMWDTLDPEVVVFDHDIPDARNPYHGFQGMAEWLSDFAEGWDSYAMELERVVGTGDRLVSLFRIRATGAGSGIEVERDDAIVWELREGKLVRLDYFNDQGRALDAAGLSE
jgi:ketosteroid isomerase-like protein